MGANNHKVVNAINVIQSLPDRVVGTAQTLKAMFDNVGEIVRLKHNDLCDYIDTDIATKTEVQGVILGQIVDGTVTRQKLELSLQTAFNPPGSVIAMASSSIPSGYLECNGALVSRTTYSSLFAVIGTTFGVGDGSTTFKIPDLRGEFIRGWDHARGIDTGRAIGTAQNGSSEGIITSGSGTQLKSGSGFSMGVINNKDADGYFRPRNIALMYCIKY